MVEKIRMNEIVQLPYQEAAKDEGTKGLVSFSYPYIEPVGDLKVKTGPGVYFNGAYPWNWVMHINEASYIEITTHLSEDDLKKDWFINIKQLSSIHGPRNYSPIALDLNGEQFVDHFNPQRDAWRIDHFQLPADLLREGENKIRIRLQDALTNYWIEHLCITDKPVDIWLMDDPHFGK